MMRRSPSLGHARAIEALQQCPDDVVFYGSLLGGRYFASGGIELRIPSAEFYSIGIRELPEKATKVELLQAFLDCQALHADLFDRVMNAFTFPPELLAGDEAPDDAPENGPGR